MMRPCILKSLVLLAALQFLTFFHLQAQRTGNIVEIFGRDRVETTSEGLIIHEFSEGMALREAMRPGMLTGMQDILFWQLATGRFEQPESGKYLADNYAENPVPLVWEEIVVNQEGVFTGDLGRAYIYTSFESPEERIALLDASGHTRVFINGMPGEGDHYDYAHTLIPFRLNKGLNEFVYTYGRFGRLVSRIVIPHREVQFSDRDMTLPSIIRGEQDDTWGGVRVVNASENLHNGLHIECVLETGERAKIQTGHIIPMAVRKLPFKIPAPLMPVLADTLAADLFLTDGSGQLIDQMSIVINVMDHNRHHERTFVSNIDGSVQYYSVAPSTSDAENQAFILSVHGASVEATNQTRAYKQKDWGHIVAPTNRRPFGFNWEEWGRIDALEVLHEARKIFHTDTARTYITGHSMGGHGTWFLGATYPDKFAAIAPAAGYPDIIGYRRTGTDSLIQANPHFEMIYRGALPGRTLDLARNYLQSGVYVLHGDADAVVPVEQARLMRKLLGGFHNNFSYYEYPGGSHWYGDHSMDWPPLFDFLQQNTIPQPHEVFDIEFSTASPGVSASNYWLRINQQQIPYKQSSVKANRRLDTIFIETDNIEHITLFVHKMCMDTPPVICIDAQYIVAENNQEVNLVLQGEKWSLADMPAASEKYPGRYGGFKLAFDNHMLFVYATGGTDEENQWYKNKARFDAETFLYRGNGSVDIIPDTDFDLQKYPDRNVIVYGNAENHQFWEILLSQSPVKVFRDGIQFGNMFFPGDDLGTYFIYPRPDSKTGSVGVVAGTGKPGMKAIYGNDYFSGITGFPDLLIFDAGWIRDGTEGIRVSGFFGNDWSIDRGDFRISQ